MNEKVLAFDIGGTTVKYACVDCLGNTYDKSFFECKNIISLEEFTARIFKIVDEFYNKDIKKIGISSLGILDKKGNCLGGTENLTFLNENNLVNIIKEKYDVEVNIINDCMSASIGEHWIGGAKEFDDFICITLGTGIGGSLFLNGKPYLGSNFRAGEIGYINYNSSKNYFEKEYSTISILKKVAVAKNIEKISGEEFLELVKNKDKISLEIFNEWTENIGRNIANMVLLVDPQAVIIGGGISANKDILLPAFSEKIKKHLPIDFGENLNISLAKLGNDAGLLGCVKCYFN